MLGRWTSAGRFNKAYDNSFLGIVVVSCLTHLVMIFVRNRVSLRVNLKGFAFDETTLVLWDIHSRP